MVSFELKCRFVESQSIFQSTMPARFLPHANLSVPLNCVIGFIADWSNFSALNFTFLIFRTREVLHLGDISLTLILVASYRCKEDFICFLNANLFSPTELKLNWSVFLSASLSGLCNIEI